MKAMGYAQRVLTKLSLSGNTLSATAKNNGKDETDTVDLSGLSVAYASSAGNSSNLGEVPADRYAKKDDLNNYMPYNASIGEFDTAYGIGNLSVSSFSTNNCRIASGSTQTGNHVSPGDIYYYNVGTNIGNVLLILHKENKGSYDKYSGILFTFNGNTTFTNTPHKRYSYYINK